jgi:hypothetical protein
MEFTPGEDFRVGALAFRALKTIIGQAPLGAAGVAARPRRDLVDVERRAFSDRALCENLERCPQLPRLEAPPRFARSDRNSATFCPPEVSAGRQSERAAKCYASDQGSKGKLKERT